MGTGRDPNSAEDGFKDWITGRRILKPMEFDAIGVGRVVANGGAIVGSNTLMFTV
jgi:hypothetical protein